MKFTKIAQDAFDQTQVNAGVLLVDFDPEDPKEPASEDIIATTTGGINVVCQPTYSDFAEDVDNAPNGMKEFVHLDGWDCHMGFTSLRWNAENTRLALGAADVVNGTKYRKIVPRRDVKQSDFKNRLWFVGDKSNGGAFAVCLLNALSTGGLSLQTGKNAKGTSPMEIRGHVSAAAQDVMPMEFYEIDPDEEEATPGGDVTPGT